MGALAEDGAADPDFGGPEGDRRLEIGAHAHRELRKTVPRGDPGKQREMRGGRLVDRRYAHQPLDIETVFGTTVPKEGIDLARRDAALLRLLAGIHLDPESRDLHAARRRFLQLARKRWPIERMDHVEERDRVAELVGLQRADQMEL